MYRRRLLAVLGVGITVGTGRAAIPRDVDLQELIDRPEEPTTSARTPTATETPTATPTETPTPTPTATPGPVPKAIPSHPLGERFVVGDGSHRFAYTAHRFMQADRLGFGNGFPAKGVFIIADMTVERLSGDSGPVPVEYIHLRGGVLKRVDIEMTNEAVNDSRINRPSLANATTFSEEPIRGILVYDTPQNPSNRHYLRITPPNDTGDAAAHAVPIGTLDTIPPLE